MKVLTLVCLFYLFSVGNSCLKENESCREDSECCNGVCFGGKCSVKGEDNGDRCAQISCPPDEICVMKQVYCIRAPCPPLPMCLRQNEHATGH